MASTTPKHIVIVGAGFGGIHCLSKLKHATNHRITFIDRYDYNFFPPLIYQVASGFLAPSDISYPLRKYISGYDHMRYRQGVLQSIEPNNKRIHLDNGTLDYDTLILATGSSVNFFGNKNIEQHALPMKTIADALTIRNTFLSHFNQAAAVPEAERDQYLNIVIAGGGPSGVELAGVLAEITNELFNAEYAEFAGKRNTITLVTADPVLLPPFSEQTHAYTRKQLEAYNINLMFNEIVVDYDGNKVTLKSGKILHTKTLIWTAGVKCDPLSGLSETDYSARTRVTVNEHLQLTNHRDIYAIGDMAVATHEPAYPQGHPQLGQVAMAQGKYIARHILGHTHHAFTYKHRGDMAMIGRLRAIVDRKGKHTHGVIAWFMWVVVHILGLATNKNRIATTWDWMVSFFTHNQSFRMGLHEQARPTETTNTQDKA